MFRQIEELFASVLSGLAGWLGFLGDHRWAAAIVLLTVIIQTALLPLAIKQFHSQRAMLRLQPEVKRLQQKYRKDRQRLQQETMALYSREGVNPAGGCLLMLPQMPVLFAMFYALQHLTAARGVEAMPFLGLGDLTEKASRSAAGWLLIVLMVATQLLSTRQLNTGQNAQQQRLMMFMPLIFVPVMINYPAALVLYWAAQGLYRFLQQAIMMRTIKLPDAPGAKQGPASAEPKPKLDGGSRGGAKGGSRAEPKRRQRAPATGAPAAKAKKRRR